jgi:hypothetical protein
MSLVSTEFGASGTMRRVRTTIVHGEMYTVADTVRDTVAKLLKVQMSGKFVTIETREE